MIHLQEAKNKFKQHVISYKTNDAGNLEIITEYKNANDFIKIEDNKITFCIQSGTARENGINGLQASDLILFIEELIKSLNNKFSCRENSITITKLQEAHHAQIDRTIDRIKRVVEGFLNK